MIGPDAAPAQMPAELLAILEDANFREVDWNVRPGCRRFVSTGDIGSDHVGVNVALWPEGDIEYSIDQVWIGAANVARHDRAVALGKRIERAVSAGDGSGER